MLKKVVIKNYKSCKNIQLQDLRGVTALLGPNGVGKTIILKGIDWACRLATRPQAPSFFPLGPSSVELELETQNTGLKYAVRLKGKDKSKESLANSVLIEGLSQWKRSSGWTPVFSREGQRVIVVGSGSTSIPLTSPALPFLADQHRSPRNGGSAIEHTRTFLSSIGYYPIDETNRLAGQVIIRQEHYQYWLKLKEQNEEDYPEWLSLDEPFGPFVSQMELKLIHMATEQKDRFEELKALLGDRGLGLLRDIRLERYSSDSTEMNPDLFFQLVYFPTNSEPGSAGFKYPDLSLGERRILRIIVALLFDQSSVILLEHPEDGIERRLLTKLLGILKSYSDQSQILLTTHSPFVVNCLEPEEVRIVSKKDGQTTVRPLNKREINAAKPYLRDEGALSDFLQMVESE